MTEPKPGDDWIYREEGEELSPEQAARKFLDQSWDDQVRLMTVLLGGLSEAAACHQLNHEGAYIFATTHTCRPTVESEREAAEKSLAELERELES